MSMVNWFKRQVHSVDFVKQKQTQVYYDDKLSHLAIELNT